jgi:multidrug resistance efflux pump
MALHSEQVHGFFSVPVDHMNALKVLATHFRRRSLANTVVRAPFDGIVAARFLDPGAAVRFGTPVISLMRPDDLWVRFAVPQSHRSPAVVGDAIEFQLENSSLAIAGVVQHVSPSIISASQELLVEARLKVPAALRDQVKAGEVGIVSSQTR